MWKWTGEGMALLALRKQQDQLDQKVTAWQQAEAFDFIQRNRLTSDLLKDELRNLLSLRTELKNLDAAVANKTGFFSQKLKEKNEKFWVRLEEYSNKLYYVAEKTFGTYENLPPDQAKQRIGNAAIEANIVDSQIADFRTSRNPPIRLCSAAPRLQAQRTEHTRFG
jgi:hypothetical protein